MSDPKVCKDAPDEHTEEVEETQEEEAKTNHLKIQTMRSFIHIWMPGFCTLMVSFFCCSRRGSGAVVKLLSVQICKLRYTHKNGNKTETDIHDTI
jgi:hypothetical protein